MPSNLRTVTITGADESVDPGDLVEAVLPFGGIVELGILWGGPEKEGRPRYPGLQWLRRLYSSAGSGRLRMALHLCSRPEKELNSWPSEDATAVGIVAMLGLPTPAVFRRIQLNRALGSLIPGREYFNARRINKMGRHLSARDAGFILQVKNPTAAAIANVNESLAGIALDSGVLLDASGGRGVLPESWPARPEGLKAAIRVGWAGGLGPENLAGQLPLIEEAASGREFWVDMESKVRDGDAKAVEALRVSAEYIRGRE